MAEELEIEFPTPEKLLARIQEIERLFEKEGDSEALDLRLLYVREAFNEVSYAYFLIAQQRKQWTEAKWLYTDLFPYAQNHLKRGDLSFF